MFYHLSPHHLIPSQGHHFHCIAVILISMVLIHYPDNGLEGIVF
jgi:hypothetical protein